MEQEGGDDMEVDGAEGMEVEGEHEGDGDGDIWVAAGIVSHWDEGNAYRVRLLEGPGEGEEVFVPIDDDCFVQLPPAAA